MTKLYNFYATYWRSTEEWNGILKYTWASIVAQSGDGDFLNFF